MPVSAGTAFVDIVPQTAGFSTALSTGLQKQSTGLLAKGREFGKQFGALIGLSIGAALATSSVHAFDDFEKAVQTLEVGLEKIKQPQALDEITAWASDFADQTGILQADILTMSARLVNMGQAFFNAVGPDSAKFLEILTMDLEDMAAATGKSVSMLMRSLGPAILNTPAKAIPLLQKLGVLTDQQAAAVQRLTDAGKDEAATEEILNGIHERFGGTAARTATAYEKLGERVNKLEVFLGTLLSQALGPLIPVFDLLVGNAAVLLGIFVGYKALVFLPGMFVALGAAIADMIPGMAVLTGEMGSLAIAEREAGVAATGLASGPLLVVGAAAGGLVIAINELDKALGEKTQAALATGGKALDDWSAKIDAAVGRLHGWFGGVISFFVPGADKIQSSLDDQKNALDAAMGDWSLFTDTFSVLGVTLPTVTKAMEKHRDVLLSDSAAVVRADRFFGQQIKTVADLKTAWADWRDQTAANLNFVGQAFGDLATKQGESVSELQKGLDKSLAAMKRFGDNLATIAKDGGAGAKALVDQLIALGPAGAAMAQKLVDAGKKGRAGIEGDLGQAFKSSETEAQTLERILVGSLRQIAAAILVANGKADSLRSALSQLRDAARNPFVFTFEYHQLTTGSAPSGSPASTHSPQIQGSTRRATTGWHGWADRPTTFLVGEGHRRERVDITPESEMGRGGMTVNLHIDRVEARDAEDFVRKLAPAMERELRRLDVSMGRTR